MVMEDLSSYTRSFKYSTQAVATKVHSIFSLDFFVVIFGHIILTSAGFPSAMRTNGFLILVKYMVHICSADRCAFYIVHE